MFPRSLNRISQYRFVLCRSECPRELQLPTIVRLVVVTFLLVCVSHPVWGDDNQIEFDVPRSSADHALNLFAQQADIQLLYPHDAIKRITVEGISGKYSVEEGLKHLLRNTCLEADVRNNNRDSSEGIVIMTTKCHSKKTFLSEACKSGLASIFVLACQGANPNISPNWPNRLTVARRL